MQTNSVKFFKEKSFETIEDPPIVAAWQVKNPQNVGNLIRLADNIGSNEIILIDDENNKRESSIKKTAGMSFNNIKLTIKTSDDFIKQIPLDYKLCAIETLSGAKNIFNANLFRKIVMLVGSETKGLPIELIEKCDMVVYVPMTGKCKSMNISHALAVSLFEWQRQNFFK